MQQAWRWRVVAAVAVGLAAGACAKHDSHTTHEEHPARVDHIEGSELARVTLSEKAIERIALETATVGEEQVKGSMRKVVPYSSLIYDPVGRTWVYTSPRSRTFVRVEVEVDYIDGDRVLLRDGPPVGTLIASVGVAELYGSEFEVGH